LPQPTSRLKTHTLVLGLLLAMLSVPLGVTARPASALRPGHHRLVALNKHVRITTPPGPGIAFVLPHADLPQQPEVASLAIPGRAGTYLVPYIQTQPDLHFKLAVQGVTPESTAIVTLDPATDQARDLEVAGPAYEGMFDNVSKGEHTLAATLLRVPALVHPRGTDGSGDRVASTHISHVARGDIISAIGDSTTEGNGGPEFEFISNWMRAQAMAADWTSPDGRNFPQAGAIARPQAPASFTSALGGLLAATRGYPVLVLNDGWSGATASAYTHIVSSADLVAEYGAARPSEWLINLGVNDPLTHQSPDQFNASLRTIIGELGARYAAQPPSIHIACPSWAAQVPRHDAEAEYLPVIQQLRATAATGAAPNFYSWYRDTPTDLADAVHPNAAGYRDMAVMWTEALGGRNWSCA
jgi:lysophospholipase L1-like esterase